MEEILMTNITIDGEQFEKIIEKYPAISREKLEKWVIRKCNYYNKMTQETLEKRGFEKGLKQEFNDEIKNFILFVDMDYKPLDIDRIQEETKKEEDEIKIIWENELQTYQEENIEWIIDRLIPNRSVCVLTGKRGTLKTFLALEIAYSIASGTDFLDKFSTRKGGVIYLDKENGISIMKGRTLMIKRGLGIEEPLKIGFICFSQLKIDKLGDIEKIESLMNKYKPNLLIVDTYRRGISFDENDAGAVSGLFVDILRPLSEKYNISILLIHHNRKGGMGESIDEMDEIRGSSDLANYSDVILKADRKGEFLILKQLKNRNAPEEKPIKVKVDFNDASINMKYMGEYEKATKSSKCAESIILWINENGIERFKTKDVKEIALKEGFKKNILYNALSELQDMGIIENFGIGLYDVKNNKI
jgi:RecA-family ATPase